MIRPYSYTSLYSGNKNTAGVAQLGCLCIFNRNLINISYRLKQVLTSKFTSCVIIINIVFQCICKATNRFGIIMEQETVYNTIFSRSGDQITGDIHADLGY